MSPPWLRVVHQSLVLGCVFTAGWIVCDLWKSSSRLAQVQKSKEDEESYEDDEDKEDEDEDDLEDMPMPRRGDGDKPSHALQYAIDHPDCDIKMVFAVRNDLKMTKGKQCAQVAHAAVDVVSIASQAEPELLWKWEQCGSTKVCLKVNSEEELIEICKAAEDTGLLTSIIEDAGRTQIEAGSKTVCAIGPGPEDLVNECTGHLKLL